MSSHFSARLIALGLFAACNSSSHTQTSQTSPTSQASPTSTPSTACERSVGGLDARLASGALLWFGEMHGTEESPRFVGDVACLAARGHARVQLGLEIPRDEQPRIDRYLASLADDAERAALLAGPFWAQADGRSSKAMLSLLDRTRQLRAAGVSLELVAYDVPASFSGDREAAMADAVAASRDAAAIFIGLSGNVHSRRTKGTSWNPDLTPTVAHLVARGLPVTTFDVSATGGDLWACMSTPDHEPVCGVHPNSNDGGKDKPWTLGPPKDSAHDGVYFVGATKASHPAR